MTVPPVRRLAARAVVINPEHQILLQHARDLPLWAIPGGGIEAGEGPEDAAIRETREETGYHITVEAFFGVYWQPQLPTSSTTYLCRGNVVGGEPLTQGPETRAVRWFPVATLPWRLPGLYRRFVEIALDPTSTESPATTEPQPIYLSTLEVMIVRAIRRIRRLCLFPSPRVL